MVRLCELLQTLQDCVSAILQQSRRYQANHRAGQMFHEAFNRFLPTIMMFVLMFSACAYADEYSGKVIKVDGEVHIIDADGNCHTVEESRFLVREMDTIVTAEGGNAIVRFNDGALSVLNERSSLQVERAGWLSHLGGKIYFTFRKVFGESRQVKTRFATLGIRGTTFIIYDDDNGQGVALQEGLLDIESPGPAFEIHRQQVIDEYETFKQKMLQQQQDMHLEFDDYIKQIQQEFIEFKENFTLQPNHVIRFDGIRVDESVFDENIKAEFENFEAIAGELLQEFHEQAQAHRERMEEEKKAKELEDESLFDDY